MNKLIDIVDFIKEIVSDEQKMAKFKEVVTGIKELIADIKDVVGFFDKKKDEA